MGKRVLVTAGPVYGPLDENKLVSNRSRGIWATAFAKYLAANGHDVTLLIPDISKDVYEYERYAVHVTVRYHQGFTDYRDICYDLAPKMDAMVLAAAVVNWIPKKPFSGKMPTKGFLPGSVISIPFVLAPRVIQEMRLLNPKLTLIGCKMTVGADEAELVEAAYDGVLVPAHCNVVVANDLRSLKTKLLIYPDRTVHCYAADRVQTLDDMFKALRDVVEDEYWTTSQTAKLPADTAALKHAQTLFDHVVTEHRSRFTDAGNNRVFGSLAVRVQDAGWLLSPRTKHRDFMAKDAVFADTIDTATHTICTAGGKATLNAPLLMRMSAQFNAPVVLHLHEQLTMVDKLPYAPPGTVRDNNRPLPGPAFYIRDHGFVKCLWE